MLAEWPDETGLLPLTFSEDMAVLDRFEPTALDLALFELAILLPKPLVALRWLYRPRPVLDDKTLLATFDPCCELRARADSRVEAILLLGPPAALLPAALLSVDWMLLLPALLSMDMTLAALEWPGRPLTDESKVDPNLEVLLAAWLRVLPR